MTPEKKFEILKILASENVEGKLVPSKGKMESTLLAFFTKRRSVFELNSVKTPDDFRMLTEMYQFLIKLQPLTLIKDFSSTIAFTNFFHPAVFKLCETRHMPLNDLVRFSSIMFPNTNQPDYLFEYMLESE